MDFWGRGDKEMINKRPLQFYVDKINNNEHFSISRYGDGEWIYMFCKSNRARINKEMDYFPEAAESLRKTISEPKESDSFFYGLQGLALRQFGDQIPTNFDWHGCDLFHHASIAGELFPIVEALQGKDVVFVGPAYLRSIYGIIPYVDFIEIPERNCYTQKEEIMLNINLASVKHGKPLLFSFSAGAFTNIMIYKLHDLMRRDWLIDFGSVWDPYVGHNTRGYHEKKITKDVIKKNLCGASD